MKKENINLLENYQIIEKNRKKQDTRPLNFVAILLIVVLLLSAYTFTLFLQDSSIKANNKELQDYISSTMILDQIKLISDKQKQLTDLNEILTEVKSLNTAFGAMPVLKTSVLDSINACVPPETRILMVDYDGQWLTIQTSSTNLRRPSEFARNLRNTKLFEDVIYSGYNTDTSVKTAYIGSVKIALKVGN
jgi:Tfp pilus assembly protein PilN